MKGKKIYFVLFLLLALIVCINFVYGATTTETMSTNEKVVMIIVNRINFDDLKNMEYVSGIIDKSFIALMNTKASGKNSEYKSYATLGWGVRAEATHNTSLFYNVDEEVSFIYERRKDKKPNPEGIVNLDINKLIDQNIKGDYGATPGALGQALRSHGYKTAVIGNGDTDDLTIRSAGLIAMDYDGYIDNGDVSNSLIKEDPLKPFGMKTDYEELFEEFSQLYDETDFIVVETGDTIRLERYKENLTMEVYEKHKYAILADIDDFIKKITDRIDLGRTKLIIATPYPSDFAAGRGERLTPVMIYDGSQEGGVLWSSTTRREGIIGNVDIGPTILSYFNLESEKMTGRVLEPMVKENNLDYIFNLNENVVNTSVYRTRVLYSFAIYEIIVSILALLAIIFRRKIPSFWLKYGAWALIGSIIAPFTLLLIPIFGSISITATYLLFIGITIFLVAMLHFIFKNDSLKVILWATGLLVFGLLLDIILGQNLIKHSLLGYDPIIGARYYGIGNEYMGLFVGGVLVFTTTLLQRYSINKYYTLLFYGVIVGIIGFPRLGANVGGTITAVFAFLFVTLRLMGQRINLRKIFYIGMAVVGVVALMAVVDLFILESKSHLAGAIQQIIASGPIVIYQIITRKISMNLRLMGVTIWSKVLLSAIAVLGILLYRPIGFVKQISTKYPIIAIGWSGIIVACIVGFAVNDSGVVAAATSVISLTSTILYLIIEDLRHKSRG